MPPVFLVGPTASGKTAVAHALGRPVISADSMQVYRGMDIGTAKDKSALLVDICAITEAFDVKRYVELATPLLPNAIVCGGTGLYIRALRQGIFDGPVRDDALRARLEALPADALFAELERLDPKAAATIDRHNPRRLVRALEVFHATGQSIRDFQTDWPLVERASHPLVEVATNGRDARSTIFGLQRDRQDLVQRIESRIDEQIAAGWLAEVRQLMTQGLEQNKTAMQAAGYRELVAHIHGQLTLPAAIALIKTRTRQLAKRQMTWFRREPGLQWVTVAADESPAVTAAKILEKLPSH